MCRFLRNVSKFGDKTKLAIKIMFYGDLVESWALLYFLGGGGCLISILLLKEFQQDTKDNMRTLKPTERILDWGIGFH